MYDTVADRLRELATTLSGWIRYCVSVFPNCRLVNFDYEAIGMDEPDRSQRWSPRVRLVVMVGASLALWAAIAGGVYWLTRLIAG